MTTTKKGPTSGRSADTTVGAQVVEHVRRLIEAGRLGPGDRLPPERELALKKIGRASCRERVFRTV